MSIDFVHKKQSQKRMQKKIKRRAIFVFGLIALFFLASWIWWRQALTPVNADSTTPVMFVVQKGEGVRSIAQRLKSEGLIRDQIAFFLLVRFLGIDNTIQAGDFRLNTAMSSETIAQTLTHGSLDVWVTTLEGWRNEEIALALAKELAVPESEFLAVASEGYMFPDTYLIPRDASASAIVALFEDTFQKRFTTPYALQIQQHDLTLDEIVTLASIVEREAANDADRPLIAGILLKRLKNDWLLDADATIQYALGYQQQEKDWWKKTLTKSDVQLDSPYNTRKFTGLPPGPISNPGLASLVAVVQPQTSSYWFYLTDTKGVTHYAETLEEHNQNIAKYLQ